jgi:cytochrome P450
MTTQAITPETRYPSIEQAECPYPLYEDLRHEGPVVRLETTGDYLVSRHKDVAEALRDTETFSNDVGATNPRANAHGYLSMLNSDPPAHAAKRKLAFEPFKPGRLKAQTAMVEEVVTTLIDRFIAKGSADLNEEFAVPVPIMVTSRLMGLPEEDYDQIVSWCSLEASGTIYLPEERRAAEIVKDSAMVEYVRKQLHLRHANPTDDILSELIQGQIARDGEYDEAVLMAEGANLLLGGIVTTAHLIGSAIHLLLQSPEEMAATRADHSRIPSLLEEALRVESPVQWRPRRATKDTEIDGVAIPKGSRVLLILGSANRDEQCFHAAEAFDPERKNVKRHMAFGLGAHFCLGAPLARLEGKIALEQLLPRVDDIKLTTDPASVTHLPSMVFRGPTALPATFRPA